MVKSAPGDCSHSDSSHCFLQCELVHCATLNVMLNSEGQLLKETEQKQVICLKSISHVSKRNNVQINEPCIICWWMYINWNIHSSPYVHAGVDLCNRLIIGGKLVDLHSVANQLACDFYFELGQFTLGDGIWLGDDRDNIHLGGGEMLSLGKM